MAKFIDDLTVKEYRRVTYDTSHILNEIVPINMGGNFHNRIRYQLSSFASRIYNDDCQIGDTTVPTSRSKSVFVRWNPVIANRLILGGDIFYDITSSPFIFYQPILAYRVNYIYDSVYADVSNGVKLICTYRELDDTGEPQESKTSTITLPSRFFPYGGGISADSKIYLYYQSLGTTTTVPTSGGWHYRAPTVSASSPWQLYEKNHMPYGSAYDFSGSDVGFMYKSNEGNYYYIALVPWFTACYYPCIDEHEAAVCRCANSYWNKNTREIFE